MRIATSAWTVAARERMEEVVLEREAAAEALPLPLSSWRGLKRLNFVERRLPQSKARCSSLGLICARVG